MFDYVMDVRGGTAQQCTPDVFHRLMDDEGVKRRAVQLLALREEMEAMLDSHSTGSGQAGSPTDEDLYKSKKKEYDLTKQSQPALLYHAHFSDGKRRNASAVASGLAIIDLDHLSDEERERIFKMLLERKEELGIVVINKSISGAGLRVVFVIPDGISSTVSNSSKEFQKVPGGNPIQEAQKWFQEKTGLVMDGVVKDLARASFAVPREYYGLLPPAPPPEVGRGVSDTDDWFEGRRWEELSENDKQLSRLFWGENNTQKMEEPVEQSVHIETSPSLQEGDSEGAQDFKGIPYSKIIARLLLLMGVDGKPAEGERNNYLYALARELRYITDFSVEKIIAVLPDWGLNASEVRSTVSSAVTSVRKKTIPTTLTNVINLLRSEMVSAEEIEDEDTPEELQMPTKLPKPLHVLLKAYPDEYKEAVLLASLAPFGGLLSRVRATYLDGATHSPSFIICVRSPQASGKSYCRHVFKLITEPIKQQDLISRELEREYNDKKKAAKNAKNQPDDPHAVIRLIPATASNAMILKRADYANGLHLLTFAEEVDTITKGNKAGSWSQKSDLYRMAFDNAEWGQDYMSDNSYSGEVQLYYNILMTGTPNSCQRLFNDVEDGLVSRVLFITLPDMLGASMPQFGKYSKKDREYLRSVMFQLYHLGEDTENQELWCEAKRLRDSINGWLELKRMEYLQNQDNPALDVFRRRAAVIGFRAGLVAWALCDCKMCKEVFDLAIWVANKTLTAQLELFGEMMNKAMANAQDEFFSVSNSSTKSQRLLDSLNSIFTQNDVILARQKVGKTGDVRMIISRWVKAGLVSKEDKKHWKKV